MKKKVALICFGILLFIILIANLFGRGWLFYQDGPYQGKVVDADTGEPLEGAVVVGEWPLETYGGPAGPVQIYCDAQETVTDNTGAFVVAKAFCFNLWPFTKMGQANFKIFKPAYDSFPPSLPVIKAPFTEKEKDAAHKYQLEYWIEIEKKKNNVVKLKKVKSVGERRSVHVSFTYIPDEKIRKKAGRMIDLINHERQSLGLQPEYTKE